MRNRNCGKKTGAVSGKHIAAAVAVAAALVLTGCGKQAERFASPLEHYRHVESAAIEEAAESFAGAYDEALREEIDTSDRKADTEIELELYKPATDMLQTYTGEDFSWLKRLGVRMGIDLAEDGGAAELGLSLNGRELIGLEGQANAAEGMIYCRVPLLSERYFQFSFEELGLSGELFDALEQREEMPDVGFLPDLLSRCAEAALESALDVKEGSETLTAGGVSAKYTTLTVTVTEDQLVEMAEDICAILEKDADLEELLLKLEELTGEAIYDGFLNGLEVFPDRIALDEDIVMTLYVDEDDAIHGRVIEYGDTVFRYAMPEDGDTFGLEVSVEQDGDILWSVSGEGERDDETLNGTLTVEADETELLTVTMEDLKRERTGAGLRTGRVTVQPTYEYYTAFGVYSLTARALEDVSYTLNVEENAVAFEVYMSGEAFLALRIRGESGPSEGLPAVSGATDVGTWSMSILMDGGLEKYMSYLAESDLPPELLQQLFGAFF